jgi:folate-binding protein YgfZ
MIFMDKEEVLIHADESHIETLKKTIMLYKLRAPVQVKSQEIAVSWSPIIDDVSTSASRRIVDPRYSGLGTWIFGGENNISSALLMDEYEKRRVLYGIAEGKELIDEIPLECNMDFLNSISFSKGCYVGQELVARTKFKGIIRKRIIPFITEASTQHSIEGFRNFQKQSGNLNLYRPVMHPDVTSGAKVIADDGEDAGQVVHWKDGRGLAKLRLEFVLKPHVLSVAGLRIFPYMPDWWPAIDPVTNKGIFEGLEQA